MKLDSMDFTFMTHYNVWTEPDLVADKGQGLAKVQGLTLEMDFSPYFEGGRIYIKLDNVKTEVRDFEVKFEGGDIAYGLNNIFEGVKVEVMNQLIGDLTTATTGIVNDFLNDKFFATFPTQREILDTNIVVDFSIVAQKDQWIGDQFASLGLKGEFLPTKVSNEDGDKHEAPPKLLVPRMPKYQKKGKEIQLMISEYTCNYLLYTLAQIEAFSYSFERDSGEIETVLYGWQEIFGEELDVPIFMHPSFDKYPNCTFESQNSRISLDLDIHIKNPYEKSIDAAVI